MAEVPEGSARWTVADWLNFLRGGIDADIQGLGGYIVRQGDWLPVKMKEAADELERLRSVALAARALVQSAETLPSGLDYSQQVVSEPALTRLEKALADAGLDLTPEEFERGVADETVGCSSVPCNHAVHRFDPAL